MGGQRLPLRRPRVHAVDEDGKRAGEVGLASYGVFAQGDLLDRVAVERMLAGVATRGFTRAGDPIGTKARQTASATSKSSVSRRFVTGTKKALDDAIYESGADNLRSQHRDFGDWGVAVDVSLLDRPLSDEDLQRIVEHTTQLTGDKHAVRLVRQVRAQ